MKTLVPVTTALLLALPCAAGAFELFGQPYENHQIPVPVSADRRMCPDCPTYYKPYKKAGATWNKVSCSFFAFKERGLREGNAFVCDGFDHLEFDRLDPGVLAVTALNCIAGDRETGIRFNMRHTWNCKGDSPPSSIDLQSVALHEMGHMLGLGHSDDPASIMYPNYLGQRRTLRADDIAGICYLYEIGGMGTGGPDVSRPPEPDDRMPGEGPRPAE